MITVLMPAFNASQFISLAIQSILAQTFQDFELLIIDDGSTDSTVDIIKSYTDKRIRLIAIKHQGVANALNLGIDEAKYGWIARMDADDIAFPERLQEQIKAAAANPDVVAWGSYLHHINTEGDILSLQKHGPTTIGEFYATLQRGEIPFASHPTLMIKKEALTQVGGYDPLFVVAQDLDLLSRLSFIGPILVVPKPLLLYRIHQKAISTDKFFLQQQYITCAGWQHQYRLAGNKPPTIEEIIDYENNRPIVERTLRGVRLWGRFLYKQAGIAVGNRRYLIGGVYLMLSIAICPKYSVSRVWSQRRCLGKA